MLYSITKHDVKIVQISKMATSKYASDSLPVSIGVYPGGTDKHFIDRIRAIT